MFKKLHLRLTLLCTLITAVILTSMAAGVLYIAQRQQEESEMCIRDRCWRTIWTPSPAP